MALKIVTLLVCRYILKEYPVVSDGICEKLSLARSAPDALFTAYLWISADSVQSGSTLRPGLPLPLSIYNQPKQHRICDAVIVCRDGQQH